MRADLKQKLLEAEKRLISKESENEFGKLIDELTATNEQYPLYINTTDNYGVIPNIHIIVLSGIFVC